MLLPASGPPPLDFRASPHGGVSTTGLDTDEEELFAEQGTAMWTFKADTWGHKKVNQASDWASNFIEDSLFDPLYG